MVEIKVLDTNYFPKAKFGYIKLRFLNERDYELKDVAEFYRTCLIENLGYKERTKKGIGLTKDYNEFGKLRSVGIRRLPNEAANIHVWKEKEKGDFRISVNGPSHLKRLMKFEKLLEEGKLEEIVLDQILS